MTEDKDYTENTTKDIINGNITRRISFKKEIFKNLNLMASFYHYDKSAKPDELLSIIIEEAIEDMYKNKFLKDFKKEN